MVSKNLHSPTDRTGAMTKLLNSLFLLFIIVVLLTSCCSYKEKIVTVRDTVLTDITVDTIFFETKPILIYDTTLPDIVTKPFYFNIDTIIQSKTKNKVKYDTVKINYAYPENFVNFSYLPEPDSTFTEIVTETINHIEEITIWNYLPYVISTALIFFVIGFITAKLR